MRERARLDAEELLPRPPFGVFGLAAPQLRPTALAEAGQVDGVWESITLAYGDWAEPAGPFVSVTSAVARPNAPGAGTKADLLGVIDQERNRLAAHAGVDEEEPPGPPDYLQEELLAGKTARQQQWQAVCRADFLPTAIDAAGAGNKNGVPPAGRRR
jgi:hypothetical protein